MKIFLRVRIPLAIGVFFLAFFLVTLKPVFIHRDGVWTRILTHASTVAVVLRDAGVAVNNIGAPSPGLDSPVGWGMTIEVPSGRLIPILLRGETLYLNFPDAGQISVRELLDQARIILADGEWVFADGAPVALDGILQAPPLQMEIRSAVALRVTADGKTSDYSAPGPTVGEALWQAGIALYDADEVTPPTDTLLSSIQSVPIVIEIVRARMVTVHVDGKDLSVRTAGNTVGDALARAGLPLAGLDYAVPAETNPLPADGLIRIVRVREELLREQTSIPFERKTQPLADLELDRTRVVQPGALGIMESVVRVRYEDGVEVGRTSQGQQVLLAPQTRIVGYGTLVVVRTAATADGPIEYYRAITVYATSYSPCRLGTIPPRCGYTTHSGKTLQKGMIAMVDSWYYLFRGQGVYVDGYGPATVEDSGVGPNAPYWIDLAYLDDDYVGWHRNTTLYFLTPVPANVPWVLP
jgi:resuscitation-promoting factor RpfB